MSPADFDAFISASTPGTIVAILLCCVVSAILRKIDL